MPQLLKKIIFLTLVFVSFSGTQIRPEVMHTDSELDFKEKVRNRIVWGGSHAQEEFIRCIQQQDPECIKNIPISSKASVLQGDSLRAITKELASKPYLKNRLEMLRALIEKVASIQEWYNRYHFNITNLNYQPLLESVIGNNDEALFDFLLASGIHPDHIKNQRGETPLFKAIQFERLEMLKKLIAHGADITIQGNYLQTPLHCAAYMALKKPQIIDELIKAGADVNAHNKFGETPLHDAVGCQAGLYSDSNIKTIEALLKNGAWIDRSPNKKKSPLAYAEGLAESACKMQMEWVARTGNWPCATDPCKKLQDTILLMNEYLKKDNQ
jgi:hypothetical protein